MKKVVKSKSKKFIFQKLFSLGGATTSKKILFQNQFDHLFDHLFEFYFKE